MTLDGDALRAAKRASTRAGLLTASGVLVVLGVFAVSAWRLSKLDAEIAVKQTQVTELEARKGELRAEIQALQSWRDVAVENAKEKSRAYGEILDEAAKLEGGSLAVRTAVAQAPIEAVARPGASAVELRQAELYDFKLWLEIPPQRRAEVERVSYYFAHPSFASKVKSSSDAAENYEVGYRGWGALREVIITIEGRDGRVAKLAFDMAEAINTSRRAAIPLKGEVGARGDVPLRGDVPIKGDIPVKVPVK